MNELGFPVFSADVLSKITVKAVPVVAPTDPHNETAIYRSVLSPNELLVTIPNMRTMHEVFEESVKRHPNLPALGTRYASVHPSTGAVTWGPYVFETYAQVAKKRDHLAYGIQHIYTNVIKESAEKWNLGIFSSNRAEWVIADLAAQAFSVAVVALYDTLGADTSEYILNHADVSVVVASIDKVPLLLSLAHKTKLKAIIALDSIPSVSTLGSVTNPFQFAKIWAKEKGIELYSFNEVMDLGIKHPIPFRLPSEEDVFCLCYTSGTTGNPKGAVLSHKNMIAVLRGNFTQFSIDATDVHISYLPLAHIFERCVVSTMLAGAGSIGFYRGDVTLLMEDIGVLHPTIFPSVPRLLNRIYDRITDQALHSGSALKTALFQRALDAKLENIRNDKVLTHFFWDSVVFSKLKALLGGRVRLIVSASAPINGDVLEFLRVAFSCQVLEAYGQTECTGLFTTTWPNDFSKDNVGPVAVTSELKLVSVPEMNYHAKDLKGEIWIRGPSVFKGYHKDVAKTKEALTDDGWLLTGDIGMLDSKGRLSIVDRKKNIFKLSQGEYIAPEKLESTFLKSSFVAQIYVHGDSLQNELVAIVVPNPETAVKWGISNGVLPTDTSTDVARQPGQPSHPATIQVCKSLALRNVILEDLIAVGKLDKLRGFEFVRAIYIEPDMFSAESGLLTPTFKLKRNEAAIKYRPELDQLYQERATATKSTQAKL
ncbi:hypothetical protein BATDEDRAFT_19355 [Batrachochytrium dendrobatidis JAM81]|uniref:Long-chain-fatty-acid--CoA ligase n=2 Tax=Batrachochytrium dendrobatidis TaxID=109871 RepID=F4P0S2_BATDJ|nr:uncharacterized protein BATDEDRAFT_19355 [Batrachochytrium dendrobatidis JAM81]EGF81644.1 hypothetical protein BATDEDRAFT_19355 [Batrachochytrium dendrobatidis JAM81]OAJ38026.1 hypothetical protein BDEG_21995 [Batrachochytrium dendrobatidis JEL423]|eukprot:XP_006677819.1 hypothetical protein BATDEDRAFT_19355 [Batrachochytrium dendrobatidis JAM81]